MKRRDFSLPRFFTPLRFVQNDKFPVLMTDARGPEGCSQFQVDAVVTSPPYPNNYDYADATRLEMTFWGEIS
ncbi:MAG: hypothetical protein E3K32_05445 [wastewater metagenome]|nr:hypothetical protein [Candidatus Loosdrechtia aerotolerans]